MLNVIKESMRISHDQLNADIQRNIDACLLDLQRVGVDTSKQDGLIVRACELFVKSEYDYGGKGEQFKKRYEELRDSLSMDGDHNV